MQQPSITRIARFALVTAELEAAEAFFVEAFDFVALGHRELGAAEAELIGLSGTAIRETRVRLGQQEVALLSFDPPGRPYPADSRSTDLWFQHFAIIVSDMDAAYARLEAVGRFTSISEGGPQVLPPSSGSVSAFKFRDAEGHPLELLAFPPGQGPAIWQSKRSSSLFLGIDHSAIAVSDTARSIAFFKHGFGLALGAQSENIGIEQARMDGVRDARVSVTGLEPSDTPPHVELLGYHVGARRPIDGATLSSDLAATHFVVETPDLASVVEALVRLDACFVSPGIVALADGTQAAMVLDPDGHRFVIHQRV